MRKCMNARPAGGLVDRLWLLWPEFARARRLPWKLYRMRCGVLAWRGRRDWVRRYLPCCWGSLLATGGRIVMRVVFVVGELADAASSAYHRVRSMRRWSMWSLARPLFKAILDGRKLPTRCRAADHETEEADRELVRRPVAPRRTRDGDRPLVQIGRGLGRGVVALRAETHRDGPQRRPLYDECRETNHLISRLMRPRSVIRIPPARRPYSSIGRANDS